MCIHSFILQQSFSQSISLPQEDNTGKIQQLFDEFAKSLVNSHSSPHRTSTAKKITVPVRRSSSAFPKPKTPTSSKLFASANGNISERRKSTGGIGTIASAGKSGESKVGYSNLTSSAHKKALSGSPVEFQPKFTKNPKYAHVRSTIPKAIIQKKKI